MWFLFPTLTFCAFSTFFRVPLQLALVIFSSQHDPSAADLASPRFLRMDSLEAPTATSQQQPSPERHRLSLQLLFQDLLLRPPVLEPQDPVEPTPMPVGDNPWTTAHPQTSPMADSQLHQRVVHTQLFKLIELDDGPQADWMGRESRLCERQARLLHLRMEGSLKDCQLLAPSFCGPRSAL